MSDSIRRGALAVALILVTGLAVAVVTGTGAIPLNQQDPINDSDVVLQAGQNELIDAAAVQDGELSLDLRADNIAAEGLSPGSQLDNAFQIRNKGNNSVAVFIETSSENIEFVDESGNAIKSEETAVSVAPSESVSVGLTVLEKASPEDDISGTFTITVLSPESPENSPASVAATSTSEENPVAAWADVTDPSPAGQYVSVDLNPEGADAAAKVRDLEDGESATIDLQETVAASQVSYDQLSVGVEGDAGTVELQADAIAEPQERELAELSKKNCNLVSPSRI